MTDVISSATRANEHVHLGDSMVSGPCLPTCAWEKYEIMMFFSALSGINLALMGNQI